MTTARATRLFSSLMKLAQVRPLSTRELQLLSQSRQALRRRARPAMNPARGRPFGDLPIGTKFYFQGDFGRSHPRPFYKVRQYGAGPHPGDPANVSVSKAELVLVEAYPPPAARNPRDRRQARSNPAVKVSEFPTADLIRIIQAGNYPAVYVSQAKRELARRGVLLPYSAKRNPKKLLDDAPLLYFPEGKTPPLLATTHREARTLAARRQRLELLKEGKQFDEERLVKSPLFGGKGGRQKLLGENPSPTAGQVADARLMEMRDIFRSGITETTGRLIYRGGDQAGSRDVVGRLGGVKSSFPELAHEKAGPQAIAKAIERGRGVVYDRVRDAAERLALKEGYRQARPAQKRSRGKLSVAAHKALRRYCRHCKAAHSTGEHRFHGEGSFHRTHLFSFNPRRRQRVGQIVEIRYKRDIGNQPGYYRHVFKVPASMYRMPDDSILIK